jgi:hypothetical protein
MSRPVPVERWLMEPDGPGPIERAAVMLVVMRVELRAMRELARSRR